MLVCFYADEAHEPAEPQGEEACLLVDSTLMTASSAPSVSTPLPALSFDAPAESVGSVGAPRVTVTTTKVTMCDSAGKSCHVAKPAHPGGTPYVSPDGGTVVVIYEYLQPNFGPSGKPSSFTAEAFDVRSGVRLSTFDLSQNGSASFAPWKVSWIGSLVLVNALCCCGPAGSEGLINPRGGGTVWWGSYPTIVQPLDVRTVLVAEGGYRAGDGGWTLGLIDTTSGSNLATVDLPNQAIGVEAHVFELHKLTDGNVLFVFANPPGIAKLDVNGSTFSRPILLPMCP